MYTEVQNCPVCLAIARTISSRTPTVTIRCSECASLKTSKFGQLLKAIGLWQRIRSSKQPTGVPAKTDEVPPNTRRNVPKTRDSKCRPAIKDVNRAWISTQGLNDIYCKWTQMRKDNDPHREESTGTKDKQRSPNERKDESLNRVSSKCSCSSSCSCSSRRDDENTSDVKRSRRSVHWADDTGSSLETVHHFQRQFSFLTTFKACLKSNTDL